MNDKGANAVLENNVGRLITKIHASNSMCPGSIQAKLMLKLEILNISKNIIIFIKSIEVIFI